jgi:hypothetical protein
MQAVDQEGQSFRSNQIQPKQTQIQIQTTSNKLKAQPRTIFKRWRSRLKHKLKQLKLWHNRHKPYTQLHKPHRAIIPSPPITRSRQPRTQPQLRQLLMQVSQWALPSKVRHRM